MSVTYKERMRSILSKYASDGDIVCKEDYPLSLCCTFRIGGAADFIVYPQNCDALARLCVELKACEMRYIVLGNASNVLFSDKGFRGVIVFTTQMHDIRCSGSLLYTECGAMLSQAAIYAQNHGLSGLEFAYGIPGTCGGGIYMNAGAYSGEMSQVIRESSYIVPDTGTVLTIDRNSHGFGYRDSIYNKKNYIILTAVFDLNYGNSHTIREKMDDFMERRKSKQPLDYPSAGSAFKRYPGFYTAQLIENAGLKGYSVGGAQVSEKHAGFIINRGDATSEDVKNLLTKIKEEILKRSNIEIECEIKIIEE